MSDKSTLSSRKWVDLDPQLTPWVLEAVHNLGFTQMTPVQASVIPLFSANKDVVVEAVTGSGKTLSFIIPVIERVLKLDPLLQGETNAIIVSPTRELAEQIYRVLESILDLSNGLDSVEEKKQKKKTRPVRSQLLIGGSTPTHADLKIFTQRRPHILVATPGRLVELLSSNSVRTKAVDCLVFDEADRLLDLGFDTAISQILGYLPKQKRVGLFSATISEAVSEMVRIGMRNPVKIVVRAGKNQSKTPTSLGISYTVVKSPKDKIPLLLDILRKYHYKKAIVYFPTCTSVTFFYSLITFLEEERRKSVGSSNDDLPLPMLCSLHGKLPPGPRHKTLEKFTNSIDQAILLTTDVAARGLDIPGVDLVIQLDPPTDPNVFLHRAGRAGRLGRQGSGIVFLNEGREEDYVDFLSVRKVQMVEEEHNEIPTDYDMSLVRTWLLEDRARHDLALRSYLSYIRFYTKHTATSIFRLANLDLVELARSHHLLRLPKMPELKALPEDQLPKDGWLGEQIDMSEYKYANPQREKARLEELQKQETNKPARTKDIVKKSNKAWSGKLERKELASERREKRKNRQIAKKAATIGDGDSDSDSGAEVDWKEMVQQKKKQKTNNGISAFDDL
ncbi:Spb4p [Sugiyamaella lignohabitans]|uniref:ATP-dependent RNA helicase n=1 Tax=Sugiyamaella lignohabitans TaxID=796027 RepID=A0A167EIP6_9ASCO|nr:Spb4p [Sugiyamaella lignohabitans]ANB14128.1 Spb4p [Sugiyamaella lignohabitans]